MSYNDDELVGLTSLDEEEEDEDLFGDEDVDFLDNEEEEDKVPEGFLDDMEE